MDKETIRYLDEIWVNYHNHKEQMAYSIFALEGGFFVGLFFLGNWPSSVERMPFEAMLVVVILTWLLFHTALRYQLRNRRLAAIYVAGLRDTLLNSSPVPYVVENIQVPESGVFNNIVDAFFFPVRRSLRSPDVKSDDLQPFQERNKERTHFDPYSADLMNYMIFKHKFLSTQSFKDLRYQSSGSPLWGHSFFYFLLCSEFFNRMARSTELTLKKLSLRKLDWHCSRFLFHLSSGLRTCQKLGQRKLYKMHIPQLITCANLFG